MTYRLLIISSIPVYKTNEGFFSIDLWVRDLEKQVEYIKSLTLVCPLYIENQPSQLSLRPLPQNIRIHSDTSLKNIVDYEKIAYCHDVIQIAANKPIWNSKIEYQFLKTARNNNICFISALSSNRAKTVLINAKNKGLLKLIKSWIISTAINLSINYFTRKSDGVFIVGKGLLSLIHQKQANIFINTASWVRKEDLITKKEANIKAKDIHSRNRLKLCIATRLEPMKGVNIAIDAVKILYDELGDKTPELLILGEGEELINLKTKTENFKLNHIITFGGQKAYPGDFFSTIQKFDLMLLTNLNDEQPRLIFDAISQGLIPICPNTLPFKALNLPNNLYYDKGSSTSLANVIKNVGLIEDYAQILGKLIQIANDSTIDNMHKKRSKWITKTLAAKVT